ncbi:MAG: LysM peptidoglycan-binding domain-containing protein [Mobilitalea sp.]
MEIYVVQQGDNVYSIAEKNGISVDKLVRDNGLIYPYNLVVGQALVIAFPLQTHTVQQGDTLLSIADAYHVSVMQLLRNNPFLFEREYIYPGETIVISYNTKGSITTNGFAYPYIKEDALLKILPNLTYISILNYTATETGDIIAAQDDSDIIKKSKEYSVIPLMVLTTQSLQGRPNYVVASSILLNEAYQEKLINNAIKLMKDKGYYGVNFIFNYLNEKNQSLYLSFTEKIYKRTQQEGLLFFITINYNMKQINNEVIFEKVNYEQFSKFADGLIFLQFVWGTNYGPPEPVCNIYHIEILVDYLIASQVPKQKIILGKPIIGYEWELPYIPEKTSANSLTLYSVYNLAYENDAVINFNEESQTPFFYYSKQIEEKITEYVVWFIDARSINALDTLIADRGLYGGAIWNMMIYYPQLWIIIYSQYDIIKFEI